MRQIILLALLGLAITSCSQTPTHLMVGTARPPITPEEVQVYSQPPTYFKEIALIDAASNSSLGAGGQKSVDTVIMRLKIEAAKLGANGLILEGFSDRQTGSLGTGVGSDSYSGHSAVGVGLGGSFGFYKKMGHARAIYVPTPPPANNASPPAPASNNLQ